MEKFRLKKHLKSGIEEVDNYLRDIHEYVESFDTSSVKMLLMALDEACMEMAKDIAKTTRGETDGLNILSNDKDDKVFDRVLTVISKVDSIKKISELAQDLKPDIEDFNELVKD